MLLTPKFSTLLASILIALSIGDISDARPTKSKRDDGMLHLPLTRAHNLERSDLHPLLLFQQHANRAHRRHALMTGRSAPTYEEQVARINKRMFLLPGGIIKKPNTKRYVATGAVRGALTKLRGGTPAARRALDIPGLDGLTGLLGGGGAKGAGAGGAAGDAAGGAGDALTGLLGKLGGGGKAAKGAKGAAAATPAAATPAAATGSGKKAAAAGAAGAAAGAAGAAAGKSAEPAAAAGNATAPAAAGNSTGGATSAGFSQIDLTAATKGGLTKSVVTNSNGTTGLDIEANDVGYISTIMIGTPPKPFRTLMDSGSADLWVGATNCKDATTNAACGNQHTFLGTTTSSSFVDTKAPFQVTYGSGAVAGTIVTDDITVAGATLKAHTFGASQLETPQFSGNDIDFDGLMGLAQSTLSNQKVLTPVEALAKQGTISAAITSFKISRLSDQKNDGQVTFGGLDATKFDPATLVTIPNVSKIGFWEGAVDAATVDGKDLGLSNRTAILDTGTTLIIMPTADATAVHAAIPGSKSDGQGGFAIPCTSTASLAFTFGGQVFNIQPQDMTFLPVDPNDPTGDCISGISAGSVGGAQEWLVGDVFLKNAYFSTDVGKNTVSLAKLV